MIIHRVCFCCSCGRTLFWLQKQWKYWKLIQNFKSHTRTSRAFHFPSRLWSVAAAAAADAAASAWNRAALKSGADSWSKQVNSTLLLSCTMEMYIRPGQDCARDCDCRNHCIRIISNQPVRHRLRQSGHSDKRAQCDALISRHFDLSFFLSTNFQWGCLSEVVANRFSRLGKHFSKG